jgi:hypothetical protein
MRHVNNTLIAGAGPYISFSEQIEDILVWDQEIKKKVWQDHKSKKKRHFGSFCVNIMTSFFASLLPRVEENYHPESHKSSSRHSQRISCVKSVLCPRSSPPSSAPAIPPIRSVGYQSPLLFWALLKMKIRECNECMLWWIRKESLVSIEFWMKLQQPPLLCLFVVTVCSQI